MYMVLCLIQLQVELIYYLYSFSHLDTDRPPVLLTLVNVEVVVKRFVASA